LRSNKKVLITDVQTNTHKDGARPNGLSRFAAAAAANDDDTPHYDHMPTHY
jgi:hypothetical protein